MFEDNEFVLGLPHWRLH